LMCTAMNRSIFNVLFGAFGTGGGVVVAGPAGEQTAREINAEDAAVLMAYARKVIIVPGYGMAVAQAQQPVRELMDLLLARGVDVEFGIHPVAGRMPGHMNVLLAEANVPYDRLKEMDEYLRSHGLTHLLYMSTDTHQLLEGMPPDTIVSQYLRIYGLQVSYLAERPEIRSLSRSQVEDLFYDWNHLDKEGHLLWGKMIGEDLKKLLQAKKED